VQHTAASWRPSYGSTCVRRQSQLRAGGFCESKVLRPIRTTRKYGPYILAVFAARIYGCIFDTRTYGPYIRAVEQKPRPTTIDTNILWGAVGDVIQRHSLRTTGSICHRFFFVERIRPILQVLYSDLELVKWVWSKMTLRIFRDARTQFWTVLGRQRSRRDVDFFIPQQRMFVEFNMFWLQKESVVT